MTMPNFLILGVPKAGTTALYAYLNQHPQIYMSPNKEPHFFAFEGKKPDFCGAGDDQAWTNTSSVVDLQAYQQLFQGVSQEKAIGEASTQYLYIPQTPERIQHYLPQAKMIAILRHPVERAYSHFIYMRQNCRETLTDFAQALEAEEQRIKNHWAPAWHYQQQGYYSVQLQRYFNRFHRDQIRIYLYDDWKRHPLTVFQDMLQFLDVDTRFVPDMNTRYHIINALPKNRNLYTFLTQENPIKTALRQLVPAQIRKPMAAKVYRKNFEKPQRLTAEMRRQFTPRFRDDILKLQDLLDRDLSHWLE